MVLLGRDIEHIRVPFHELSKDSLFLLVEYFCSQPRFAVIGVPWYIGTSLATKAYRLSAFIKKDKQTQHAPFLFSYGLGALRDIGELLGVTEDVVLQASAYNQVQIDLSSTTMNAFALPCLS